MTGPIYFTNLFIPAGMLGFTPGPFSLIRPSAKADAGLLAHEATHRAQFWRNPLFPALYLLSAARRLQYELEAYKVQLSITNPDGSRLTVARAAELLASPAYRLNLTAGEAAHLLTA